MRKKEKKERLENISFIDAFVHSFVFTRGRTNESEEEATETRGDACDGDDGDDGDDDARDDDDDDDDDDDGSARTNASRSTRPPVARDDGGNGRARAR